MIPIIHITHACQHSQTKKSEEGDVKTYGVVPERYSDDDIEHH